MYLSIFELYYMTLDLNVCESLGIINNRYLIRTNLIMNNGQYILIN